MTHGSVILEVSLAGAALDYPLDGDGLGHAAQSA
jgi:hypothetical protein